MGVGVCVCTGYVCRCVVGRLSVEFLKLIFQNESSCFDIVLEPFAFLLNCKLRKYLSVPVLISNILP